MRLTSDVWVGALIRRAQAAGAFATVARRGDATAGSVLVKLWNPRTREARLYAESLAPDGDRLWIEPRPDAAENELDAYCARQAGYDPDLWVVEIEDGEGRHFLTEAVEKS